MKYYTSFCSNNVSIVAASNSGSSFLYNGAGSTVINNSRVGNETTQIIFDVIFNMIKFLESSSKKLMAAIALVSIEVIVLAGIFSAALFAFISIAKMIFKEKKSAFDLRAFNFLSNHVSAINTDVMRFFTFLGTHTFLIPANICLAAYFLFIKKHRWYSIHVPVVALSSLLLMFILKFIFHRDRPLTPLLAAARGFSFPSGHALMSVTFYGLLIFILWQNEKNNMVKWVVSILLVLLILAIGISRVYLRVHFASDVIAGFSVGLMWLLISLWILKKIEKFSRKKVDPAVQTTG